MPAVCRTDHLLSAPQEFFRFSMQQLHADEYGLFPYRRGVAEEIKNAADVGMSDLSRQVDFAFKTHHGVRLPQNFGTYGLDGYSLLQFKLIRLIHISHSTACDETDDPETSREKVAGARSVPFSRRGTRTGKHRHRQEATLCLHIFRKEPLHFLTDFGMSGSFPQELRALFGPQLEHRIEQSLNVFPVLRCYCHGVALSRQRDLAHSRGRVMVLAEVNGCRGFSAEGANIDLVVT